MNFDLLQEKIKYNFKDKSLLKLALTHSSFGHEVMIKKVGNNERLEFLGDAVLELVVSDYLYRSNQSVDEGDLSKKRASIVCEPGLAYSAREIELGQCILLGKGEILNHGNERDSILSDAFEALIGAIYLDGGLEEAKRFIYDNVINKLEERTFFYDAKTELQVYVQNNLKVSPTYEVIDESGPSHDKTFVVNCLVDGVAVGTGSGRSKKLAQQNAAAMALSEYLKKEKEASRVSAED